MKVQTASLYSSLLRDRYPVATAWVETEDTPVKGRVRFFKTPIGTVVLAELHGASSLQDLAFSVGSGSKLTTANLSPNTMEDGGSTFIGITHRFAVEDLLGKTVTVRATADTASTLSAHGLVRPIGVAQNA